MGESESQHSWQTAFAWNFTVKKINFVDLEVFVSWALFQFEDLLNCRPYYSGTHIENMIVKYR